MNSFKSSKYFFLYILIAVFVSTCSKFEEGPFLSLVSVKNRLSRDWKVEYSLNLSTGISHSADFNGWVLSFNKNGSFSETIVYNLIEADYSGKWEIVEKNQLKLEYATNSSNLIEFYTIIRLSKKELWLKNETEEIHYYSE